MRHFLLLCLLSSVLGPLVGFAQSSPKQNAKVWLGVHVKIRAASDYAIRFQSSQPGEPDPYYAWHNNWAGLTTAVESPNIMAQIVPGRIYGFHIGSASMRDADVQFNVPPGYTLYFGDPYLERTPRTTFVTPDAQGGAGGALVNIELRPNDGASSLPAGFALPPRVSDVLWAVSLGQTQSGGSAGALRWRHTSVGQDLLDAFSLVFAEPDGDDVYTYDYADGAPKYFGSAQAQIYVRRNAGANSGYVIEAYDPYVSFSYANNDPANDWSFNGSPYATYTVSNPDGSWQNRVRITRLQDAKTETWTLGQNGSTTTIEQTNSLQKITLVSSQTALPSPHSPYPGDASGTQYRRERVTITDGAGNNLAAKVDRYYRNFVWNEELIAEIANPDATNNAALVTRYTYHDSGWPSTGNVTKLKAVVRADGSWEKYEYYDDFSRWGQIKAVYRPWQDSSGVTPDNASSTNCHYTVFTYAGERGVYQELLNTTETKLPNSPTTSVTTAYSDVTVRTIWNNNNYSVHPNQIQQIHTTTSRVHTSAGVTLTTTRAVFHNTAVADYRGKLYYQDNPDGTRISAAHIRGDHTSWLNALTHVWDATYFTANASGGCWQESYFNGTAANPGTTGATEVTSWLGKPIQPVWLTPNRSTRRDVIRRLDGGIVVEVTYLYTGSGSYKIIAWNETDISRGQWYAKIDSTGAHVLRSFIAGRVNYETRADGTQTQYFFDDLMRVNWVQHKGVASTAGLPAQDDVNIHYTLDAAGRIKATSTTAGGLTLTTSAEYDPAGQVRYTVDERGLQTDYSYPDSRTVTVTAAGATTTTARWVDGSVKTITGSAVVASAQSVTVNSDGTLTRAVYSGPGGTASPRWTKVTTDWAGRTLSEERPAPPNASPSTFVKAYAYYANGKLKKTTESNLAPTYFKYDALGELEYTWLDIGSDTNDAAPAPVHTGSTPDRVSRSRTNVIQDGGVWWMQSLNYIYPDGVTSDQDAVIQSETRQRLVPYAGTDWNGGHTVLETRSFDIFRNETTQVTDINRASRLTTVTTNPPDSTTNEVITTLNGRKVRQQSAQNLTYNFHYDSLGRLVKQTDPRTDPNPTPVRIGYHTTGTGAIGQIAWRQDTAGNQTSFTYESATGRLSTEIDPLGKVARYGYTARGERHRTWGDTAYPVELGFNDYGEQVTMRTFRNPALNFAQATWPALSGAEGDPTTWAYDPATGTLTSKTDAASKIVAYTYNARGQLKTRTWARGVTTTYTYSATTAEQTAIDYSDSTPDLTYTYNRLGQNLTIGDVTGTRTFNYSATTTQLTREDLGSFVGTRSVSHGYDSLGRTNSLGVGLTSNPGGEYNFTYGYDTYGRMNQVWTFTYSYLPNSNLLSAISDTSSAYTQTRSYEPNRDLLDVIETKWSAASKAKFDYTSDPLGRRTAVAKTGEMFSRYSTSGLDTTWGYNDRSEVTAEVSKLGGTSTVLTGRNDAYSFDPIGNRATTTHNSSTSTYTLNALNQYTQRTVPGVVDVAGLAPAAATVNVAGSSAGVTRHNDYYFKGLGVTNTTSAVWSSFTIDSTFGGSSPRTSFTAFAAEPFTYDLDGNLLSDGRWDYTYDAENRLVSMQTHSNTTAFPITPADARKIVFKNDYLGRRVQKTVLKRNAGNTDWETFSDTKSLYDGWNLIWEMNASTLTQTRAYLWGLDWSGTLQGAGGVGGLLYQNDLTTSTTMLPAYDGNGNVMALLKRSDSSGTIIAAYEYDAFGQTLAAYGSHAAGNPFRFSTKYTDTETGLVYYGLRYYSPSLGRFINRDPIEEQGGLNLYGFCGNNGISRWDMLGMDPSNYIPGPGTYQNWHGPLTAEQVATWSGSQITAWYSTPNGFGDSPNLGLVNSMPGEIFMRSNDDLDSGRGPSSSGGTNRPSGNQIDVTLPTLRVNYSSGSDLQDAIHAAAFDLYGRGAYSQGPTNTFELYPTRSSSSSVDPNSAAQDLAVNAQANPYPTNNSGEPIIVVTPGGNALPVPPGGTIQGSPDGRFIDVKGPNGQTTGDQIHGGHKPSTHPDPRGQAPHAHRPGVTNPDGTPWLPVRPEPAPIITGRQVAGGVAVVGTGYLIYRGVRMIPSLVLPPLWPTIPINAVVP